MIRFSCPRCKKILKVVEEGAGRPISCPKCGQRMLIPTSAKPAPINATLPPQLTSIPVSGPTSSVDAESDNLMVLGLRQDAESEGRGVQELIANPTRSWAGISCAFLALTLALAAMPVAVIHHLLLGAGLAAFGIVLALLAVFNSLFRRGLGLAMVALMVGASVLFSIVVLAGGPTALLHPTKEGMASLRAQELQGQKDGNSDHDSPTKNMVAETKSESDQTEGRRTDEKGPKQTTPSTGEKTPATEESSLDDDEIRELNRWIENLRTDLGDPNDNPIRYRDHLQKAKEKAGTYSRDFATRKIYLDFNLLINRIKEDGVYLNGFSRSRSAQIVAQDHRGMDDLLVLKMGQDISKEKVLELKRGQSLLVRADVVEVAVEEIYLDPRSSCHVRIAAKNLRFPERDQKGVGIDPDATGLMFVESVQKLRESVARARSASNLKQLALAMHNYHDTYGNFPPQAICDKNGKPLLSWRVAILPFIEQQNLYKKFRLDEPWDSEHNKKLLQINVKTYTYPLHDDKSIKDHLTFYQGIVGKGTFFEGKKGLRIPDFTDGLSNTIMIVEASKGVPWTKPEDIPYDADKPLPKLGLPGSKIYQAALCDGSVQAISPKLMEQTLRNAITRDDGYPPGPDW